MYVLTLTRQLSGTAALPRTGPLYQGLVTSPTGLPHGTYSGQLDGDPVIVEVGDFTDVQPGLRFPQGRRTTP